MSDPANQPPPRPRSAQKPNPRAASFGRVAWQDRLTGEGRRRLVEEGVLPPPPVPTATPPNYANMTFEQKRAAQDAARGGR